MSDATKYGIKITLTNETEGGTFSEWCEDVEDYLLRDDGTPDFGAIYRIAQRDYGRCQSSVYVDTKDGGVKRVGWYFVSRQEYEGRPLRTCQNPRCDNPRHFTSTYLRGAWVTIYREVEPARPAQHESVGI